MIWPKWWHRHGFTGENPQVSCCFYKKTSKLQTLQMFMSITKGKTFCSILPAQTCLQLTALLLLLEVFRFSYSKPYTQAHQTALPILPTKTQVYYVLLLPVQSLRLRNLPKWVFLFPLNFISETFKDFLATQLSVSWLCPEATLYFWAVMVSFFRSWHSAWSFLPCKKNKYSTFEESKGTGE